MSRDRGSVAPAVVGATALLALVLVATASLGVAYAARAQAQAAADAAALAAAVATFPGTGRGQPAWEAGAVAARNGARLVRCVCPVDPGLDPRAVTLVVEVTAEVPIFGSLQIKGASRAEFDPVRWLGR